MPRFALRKPVRPGQPAKRDSEYERCGTANVFCAVEPKVGRHFTFATPDRSAFEFAKVVFQPALRYVGAKTIHLVVDNLNIHSQKSLTDAVGDEVGAEVWGRFTVHYTPRHGSWLNHVEIEIGLFARQCLGKRRIPNLQHLQREVKRLESPHESRRGHHQLAIHTQKGSLDVRL